MATPKYSYQENPSNELTGFKIEDGKYKDVIYTYGKFTDLWVRVTREKTCDKFATNDSPLYIVVINC